MTPAKWTRLVFTNVRRARRQFVLSAFGIAVGIASLAFFGALSSGVRGVVLGRVFRADRIDVEPAKASFDTPLGGLLGGPRPITDETVAALASVRGVKLVAPRQRLLFPAKGWGGERFFGSARYAEVLGDGVDPAAVGGDGIGPLPFADLEDPNGAFCTSDPDCKVPGEYCAWDINKCQKPVPVIVSRFLVEVYNGTFAGQHGLPKISGFVLARFKGFTFNVELGTSYVGPPAAHGRPRMRRVMLVGVSDRAVPIGISFPLPYVRRWNAEYVGPEAARGYTSVSVEVADKSAVTRVAARARELGLSVVDSGAEQAGLAITLITLLFTLVSLSILVVATINIAHSFFRAVAERRREIGILRAVGASRRDVQLLLLGEAAAVGVVGGLVGVLVAFLSSLAIDVASRRFVPDFPFKPESYFQFSPGLVAASLAIAVVACVGGAWLPARAAALQQPAEALSGT